MPTNPTPESILHELALIQRMDRGSVSVIREGLSGPCYNHQCYEDGRNVSRYVPREQVPALKEAINGYHRFEQLMAQYVRLVVEETRAERHRRLKKKAPTPRFRLAQEEEVQQLIARFETGAPTGLAVQQMEQLMRAAIFKPANALVGWLLQTAADRVDAAYQPKPGERRAGRAKLQVQGIFGIFELQRDYYHDADQQEGHYPADAALGLEVGYTPALAKLICLEGADESTYQKAERHLEQTGGILVSGRQVQRVVQRVGAMAQAWQERPARPGTGPHEKIPILYLSADATGISMVPEELAGRKGKQPDGTAKTRQVYLGCAFTQHGVDDEGRPVRDLDSTTYVSGLMPIDEFGPVLRQEAVRRGFGRAGKVVVLIDGANGLENMATLTFPTCLQIVDFYHAMEHAGSVLEALLGKDHPDYRDRLCSWAKGLLKNRVEALIGKARKECLHQPNASAVEKALHYFVTNVSRMQYGTFRKAGYFIGSGVIEAGCKTVVGGRCKQSGMFWSEPGAEHILALRSIHYSRRLDEFWKHRLNTQAARNDSLPLVA